MLEVKNLKDVPSDYSGPVMMIRPNGTKRILTVNNEPSMTDESFAEECDTNYILEKFRRTGQVTHLAKSQGVFADVSSVDDLLPSLTKIKEAEDAFLKYPAEVRRRFDNDVVKLLRYLEDPANDAEAIKLGLRAPLPDVGPAATPAENKSEARVSPKNAKTTKAQNDDD